MKIKMMKKGITVVMFVLMLLTTLVTTPTSEVQAAGGITYYVSSLDGSDSNTGTSEDQAFKSLDMVNELTLGPGDQVLLERGSVFESQFLHIKGSGSADSPIQIGVYGMGSERPKIHTNGAGQWYQDYGQPLDNSAHVYRGTVSTSLLLEDVEYIEISGLEITNDGPDGDLAYNSPDVMNRTGVAGFAKNKGTMNHIVIDDLYIHDVIGNVYDKHMMNGGIYFGVGKADNEAVTGIPKYDDLVIKNCQVENTNRWGIAAAYTAYWQKFTTLAISDEIAQTYGSSNVVIENNFIKDAGGDALTTMYCFRPLVQYNVSDGAARQINYTDYAYSRNGGRVAAGIWPWKCKDSIFQYNECYDMRGADNGNGDGQAWDADYGDGTIYQYNYSHENSGGAVMFCASQSYRNTFRYNISQNDDMGVINSAGQADAHVYNNTFYIKEGVSVFRHPNMLNGPVNFENNIFYYTGNTPKTEDWHPDSQKTYANNLYYNYANLPTDKSATVVTAGSEVLKDPGSAPMSTLGVINLHEDVSQPSMFDGYQLAANSPAIDGGKLIADANGYVLGTDFFGREINAVPSIGAAESDIKNYNLDILDANFMMSEDTILVPSTPSNPITVGNVLSNITVKDDVRVAVYDGDTEVLKGPISDTMVVKVIDPNGNSKTYEIDIKNRYQWALDFVDRQQGNVWFSQFRDRGSESEYSNLTIYDKQYPNWIVDGYYGPGIDAPRHGTVASEATQGLLMDTPGASHKDGTSMVFRAPKSGVISFAIKGERTDPNNASKVLPAEPYLRQAGNSGGSVIVRLTLNGVEIQSCELSQSLVSGNFPNIDQLEVKVGDYLRVEAVSMGKPSKPSVHITPDISYVDVVDPIVDSEAPSVPKGVEVSDITTDSALLTWIPSIDNVDVDKYEIYNGDTLIATISDDVQATISALDENTNYNLTIIAVDKAGNRSAEAMVNFTTKAEVAPVVDKSDLQTLYDESGVYEEAKYTTDTWAVLVAARTAAQTVLDDVDATQEQVNSAAKALSDAINALETIQGETINTDALQQLISESEALIEEAYTPESWVVLADALTSAKEVLANPEATQADVDVATAQLQAAKDALVAVQGESVNTEALQQLIKEIEALNANDYTTASWKQLQEVLADAQATLLDPEATQADIDAQVKALQAAKDKLVKKVTIIEKPSTAPTAPTVSGNGGSTNTGDTTDVSGLFMLCFLALVSGGYVWIKGRKRGNFK